MSLVTILEPLILAIKSDIGKLSTLKTSANTSLVNSINEIYDLTGASNNIVLGMNDTVLSNSIFLAASANVANTLYKDITNNYTQLSNNITLSYNKANSAYNLANSVIQPNDANILISYWESL